MKLTRIALAGALSIAAGGAHAACSFENDVPVTSLSAGFQAWKAVTSEMAECGNFEAALDQEFRKKQAQAFAAKPSLYEIGGVANSTIQPLLSQDLIRPLDDLVAKYGNHLKPNQLIRSGGEIVAIAMMVNDQHLMYRADIFEDLGLAVPETWEEVLAAAEEIEAAGVVDYPLGVTMKTGWNLGEEFINMYLGMGGEFFGAGNRPAVNNDRGVAALEMMKRIIEYADPEYLVSDSTYVQQQFQQGKIAMANLWASRGSAMNNPEESEVVGLVKSAAAPKPTADAPRPASSLWWDGFVIAKNISDEKAEAAFRVALEGIDREMVEANNDVAVWLVDGYQPTDMAKGAIATAEAGAAPYPASPQMGLMHTSLGNNLAAYFTGEATADEALASVEQAYLNGATEAGLVE